LNTARITLEPGEFAIPITIDDSVIVSRYDHVHHATILTLLEEARVELLRAIGTPNDAMLDEGLALVIARIDIKYLREVRRGEIQATCLNGRIEGRFITVHQRILNDRGKTAVEAKVDSIFMSTESRRALDIPEGFMERFRAWQENRSG